MKTASLALCVLPLALATTGCDLINKLSNSDKRSQEASDESEAESGAKKKKKKGASSTGCELKDEPITADVTLEKDCQLELDHSVTVSGGATLTILAGSKLSFAPGTYLSIEDAKLVVKGTAKEPVTFTSRNATKAAGDWIGLFFAAETMSGTRVENARIEYAGQEASLGQGGVTIGGESSQKRVSFVGTTFANNARAAIQLGGERGGFAEFSKNRFESNPRSLVVPVEVLGTIGTGNSFADPIETWGRVHETASWPAFGVPVHAKASMMIGSTTSTPTLTLAKGTVMKFTPGTYLAVGEDTGGSLVAPGCTFTSSADQPQAGDWVGLFVYKLTQKLDLSGATIEAAGNDAHGGRGAITFYDVDAKEARGINLASLTVKNTKTAALASPDHDCGTLAAQITVSQIPACRPE